MAQAQSTLSHLSEAELKTLLARVAGFALYKLGSRVGHGPEMYPDDLTHQAFADTLTGRRRWNREIHTIEEHLTATVSSYIRMPPTGPDGSRRLPTAPGGSRRLATTLSGYFLKRA